MTTDRLTQQIQFILEIDKLKSVLRRTSLLNEARRENSAEHSWHIAVMAMVLAEHADEAVNIPHVIKMLLIHDIVEIDAGDTFAYSNVSKVDQHTKERLAAERIFGLLPDDQRDEMLAHWEEFEAMQTPEAKFANAMDRLMPTLHNYHNQGGTWHENGVTLERIQKRMSPIGESSTVLGQLTDALLQDALAQGMIQQ
ncbi:MAG: HD domain-containing protein [Caldilineaceae bacterium]